MDKVKDEMLCAVCESNTCELYHSGVGAASYMRCSMCEEQGAEHIGVLCFCLYTQGGPETIAQNSYLSVWWPTKRSFYENRYIGWNEIIKIYPEMEAKFAEDDDIILEN